MEPDSSASTSGNSFIQNDVETNSNPNTEPSYSLKGEKIALLFLHQDFDDEYEYDRSYVKEDSEKLKNTLQHMGFSVGEFYDYNHDNVIQEIRKTSSIPNIGCVFVYVSSRGEKEIIYARNRFYSIDNIIDPLKDSYQLVGIPKVVIFHTTKYYSDMEVDGGTMSMPYQINKLPTHADMLIVKLNTSDKHAVNPPEGGSVFVTILSKMLENHCDKLDLKSILVLTNNLFINCRNAMEDNNSTKDYVKFLDTQRKLLFFKENK